MGIVLNHDDCSLPLLFLLLLLFHLTDQTLFGEELDHPLFFISATVEMSERPLLPVYNLTMVAESNSRSPHSYTLSSHLSLINAFLPISS